jgi:hypothetical protein
MTPLLNIEDLSQDVVLPSLLDARATSHPGLFRAIDGRSVLWDFSAYVSSYESWEGCHSRMRLIQNQLLSFYEVTAGMGFLQLKAQRRNYNFLVSCTRNFLQSSRFDEGIEQASNHAGSNERLSLLAQPSRLD